MTRAEAMLALPRIQESEYYAWLNDTREYLAQSFGEDSRNVSVVAATGQVFDVGDRDPDALFRSALGHQIALLKGCLEQLRERTIVWQTQPEGPGAVTSTAASRRVFIVHGHDDAPREAVARLLERLGFDPIILHEQPNKGRTIIEKFEDYSDVGFAVVLLTPDDRGGRHDEPFEAQRPRARQNVWLELGFFLGKLGRSHVCALYHKGVEIPSDYQGVVLQEVDAGGAWKYRLAEELSAAGYPVDMNRVNG